MKARIINGNEFGGKFTNAWLENNLEIIFAGQLVSEWELTDVLPDEILRVPKLVGGIWMESMTDNEIDQEDFQRKITDEFNLYQKRKSDGETAYLKVSAELRLDKLSGKISQEIHDFIEQSYKPVRDEIMCGQWITALKKINAVDKNQVGVEFYERLHAYISNYVNENY